VQKWLAEHPDHNRTVVEQLMSDAGHALVYTPPYCPEVQPIELLWAQVKRYVAARSTHGRSLTEARQQTEEGFEAVTKMFCNSIVRHCHDWIDQFLQTDAAEDLLQCGTLAGVIKHLPLLKAASIEISALWLWVSGVRRLCVYWTRTQAKRLACLRRCSLVASFIPFSPSKLADGSNSKLSAGDPVALRKRAEAVSG